MKLIRKFCFFSLIAWSAQTLAQDEIPEKLQQIELPPGFEIHLYAQNVKNARQLALGDHGTVFAGSRKAGSVHAVVDRDGDHFAESVYLIDEDLEQPSGIEFKFGSLYVGAVNRILRYDDIEGRLDKPPEPEVVSDSPARPAERKVDPYRLSRHVDEDESEPEVVSDPTAQPDESQARPGYPAARPDSRQQEPGRPSERADENEDEPEIISYPPGESVAEETEEA